MSTIHFGRREIHCKLVYVGPALGGKTTNLVTLHAELDERSRGELFSLASETDRTLFFDWMMVEGCPLEDFQVKFSLYSVPGQAQEQDARRSILHGVDGLVFVADSAPDRWLANTESLLSVRQTLAQQDLSLDDLPWVIQFNKRDLPTALPVALLQAELNPFAVPAFEAVALHGVGVRQTFDCLRDRVLEALAG